MKTYICEICGDAYLGDEKPHQCPFCGSGKDYIKEGGEALPITNETIKISEKSRENLMKTLRLEINAVAVYQCMANKTDKYEIRAMYKRLAKVESEHAVIVTKLLKIEKPEVMEKTCSDSDKENFDETIKLENNASDLYAVFGQEAQEAEIKKFFEALTIVEKEHIDLMRNYL